MKSNKIKNQFFPDFKSDEIGYSVRPMDNKILIMVEIYKQNKYKECIDKLKIVKNEITSQTNNIVNVISANEVLEQINKHTGTVSCIEVTDILNGDFVTIPLECEEK